MYSLENEYYLNITRNTACQHISRPFPSLFATKSVINNNWTRCIYIIHKLASSSAAAAAAVHRRIPRYETWGTDRVTEGQEGVESGEKVPLHRGRENPFPESRNPFPHPLPRKFLTVTQHEQKQQKTSLSEKYACRPIYIPLDLNLCL